MLLARSSANMSRTWPLSLFHTSRPFSFAPRLIAWVSLHHWRWSFHIIVVLGGLFCPVVCCCIIFLCLTFKYSYITCINEDKKIEFYHKPDESVSHPVSQLKKKPSWSMIMNSNKSQLDNATLSLFRDTTIINTTSVIYAIVTVINLVGNGLSLWILLFRTYPKSASIIFMINLTLTDMALGAALPFQIMYQLQGYDWTLGPEMCRYLSGIQAVFMWLFSHSVQWISVCSI